MERPLIFYVLLVIGVICESIGDFMFRKGYLENKRMILVIGYGVYIIGSLFWALSLKYDKLSILILYFVILNAVIDILIGNLILKEELTTKQYIGVFLILVALYLIES